MELKYNGLRFTGPVNIEIENLVEENEMLFRSFKELWEENELLKKKLSQQQQLINDLKSEVKQSRQNRMDLV